MRFLSVLLLSAFSVHAEITVYYAPGQVPFVTTSAAASDYTGVAAYNPTTLLPPPVPTPAVPSSFPVALRTGGTPGASIPQLGSFVGFSIEMSVSNQVLGKNATFIQVPFLNLLANIQQRAGRVMVRVGGNSQESAKLVGDGIIPDGRILQKNLTGVTGTTQTPPLEYSEELLYMMANISALVNVRWFLGIPWFITKPFDLSIVASSQQILGDKLLGYQASNEPDLYTAHGHRLSNYSQFDYFGEFSDLLGQLASSGVDPDGKARTLLIGPSIADANWTPEDVWNTGFVDVYNDSLAYLSVEKYPTDNCAAAFHTGGPINDPQTVFPNFLTHKAHTKLLAPYLNSTAFAQTKGKKLLMFETNTASCGGFGGISDVFGAALWGLDYALQMAHSNFSGAMFHVGGQNVFYNPFTSPPTNESTFHQWTIGPIYYSALVAAETLGPSNTTQVLDLGLNGGNEFTPGYGIYEAGEPVRVALFNYITDPTGVSDVTAVISVAQGGAGGGGATPASVKVKYLKAASVSQKGGYTWAGQTFGGNFDSDGRLMGAEDVQTVPCDTTALTCSVKVPAPGFALVFLSDAAETETLGAPSTTFKTTALTRTQNTATVDPSILATSNGHGGSADPLLLDKGLGSTSRGSANGDIRRLRTSPTLVMAIALVLVLLHSFFV